MTQRDFEMMKSDLKIMRGIILRKAEKQVTGLVKENIGEEFKVLYFSERGFHVSLMKDDKPIFGASWHVFIGKNPIDKTISIEVSIGTMGGFIVGDTEDPQYRKYQAFGIFLSLLNESGLADTLKKCYADAEKNSKEYNDLLKEFGKED